MKQIRLISLLLLFFTVLPLPAQKVTYYYGNRPENQWSRWEYPKHEVGIGLGFWGGNTYDVIRDRDLYGPQRYSGFYGSSYDYRYSYNPSDLFEKSHYYLSHETVIPAINLRYFYSVTRWLQIGGTMSFYHIRQDRFVTTTHKFDSELVRNYFSVIPTVRVNYVRRPKFSLYSALGVGITAACQRDFGERSYDSALMAALDITYIGISVGDRIYVSGEVAGYTAGILKLTAGYRF